MTARAKHERWSFTVGTRPHRVTVFEREPGGVLYARAWDPALREGRGDSRTVSLGHRDREAAQVYAARQHAKLIAGEVTAAHVTLGALLAQYERHEVSRKATGEQATNRRQAELFARVLGADKDPRRITKADWQRLTEARRSGAVDARGRYVADPARRRAARDRTVEADLRHLSAVLSWATKWQDRVGRYLLSENPVRGFPIPREKNPRRPIMTQDRLERLLGVADRVAFEVVRRRERLRVRSYLRELLVLADQTGRRLSAIVGLRYEDVHAERTPTAPHGAITWRAELDKKGREWPRVAITAAARDALDRVLRERPGIGAAPLFPAPKDLTRPIDRHLADRWLREAERLAGLEPQAGSLWHAFRRKAATELKHAPDKDVMQLLGWTDLRSLKTAYQHADAESMLIALESRRELREAR